MNRPIKHPPIVGVSVHPLSDTSATSIGAPRRSSAVAYPANPTGEAGAPNLSTQICDDCDGTGEAMILALDATREEVGYCDLCQGTGEVEATCETCSGKLVDGWCSDCEDYGLTFVERIAPGRIAL